MDRQSPWQSRALYELLGAGAFVAGLTALFNVFFAPREVFFAFGALFFSSCAILGAALWRNRRVWEELPNRQALLILLVIAAVLRLSALIAPISLSDDIWRYLWDGKLLLEGQNPYAIKPVEYLGSLEEHKREWEELYGKLNSPATHTLYPPLAQAAFAAALVLEQCFGGGAERWLRGIFVLFDLGALALLALLLIRLKRKTWWAAVYGWHPLVYWEVAGGGHSEALGMIFLVIIIGATLSGRVFRAGAAIALAGLAKWTFLAISPVVGIYIWRRQGIRAALAVTIIALLLSGAAYLPLYFPELWTNHSESLRLYSQSFSFNNPLYYSLRALLGYQEGITPSVSHITGPLLTGMTILTIGAAALWQNGSTRRLLVGVLVAFGGYLLFSPVYHPWYGLPLLMSAAIVGTTTPAVLGALTALSYAYYAPWSTAQVEVGLMTLQVMIVSIWAAAEYGPGIVEKILRRRGERKARAVQEVLSTDERLRILDLGGAEGFVAQALAERGHEVSIIDIADRNRTDLPYQLYDGESLPFEDQEFDLILISYVLHHAGAPDKILAEALRAGKKVVILETVYKKEWDRRFVTFLDHSANALRGMKPEPLQFDRVQGWVQRIEDLGGEVVSWDWLGEGVHKHVRIVCETRN